jgi:hypothetical protein
MPWLLRLMVVEEAGDVTYFKEPQAKVKQRGVGW